jgi:hypothetical protein
MLGVLLRWWVGNVAPYLGADAVATAGPPRGHAQPFANVILAVGDRVAGMAIDDKAILAARN